MREIISIVVGFVVFVYLMVHAQQIFETVWKMEHVFKPYKPGKFAQIVQLITAFVVSSVAAFCYMHVYQYYWSVVDMKQNHNYDQMIAWSIIAITGVTVAIGFVFVFQYILDEVAWQKIPALRLVANIFSVIVLIPMGGFLGFVTVDLAAGLAGFIQSIVIAVLTILVAAIVIISFIQMFEPW